MGIDKLRERADKLKNPTFIENLKRKKGERRGKKIEIISKEDERINNDPHNQLYSGTFWIKILLNYRHHSKISYNRLGKR